MAPPPSTMAEAIRSAIVRAIVATLAAGAALVLATPSDLVDVTRPPSTEAPSDAERVAEAAEAAGLTCWAGAAPAEHAGTIPSTVVWHYPSGRLVVSTRLVGPALEAIFGDGDLPGHAVSFCA